MNPPNAFATGVPGLDVLLNGGLSRSALAVIVGPAGAGKTVLASQMLFHAVQQNIPGLILTTYSEGNVKLLEHLRSFTFFDESAVGQQLTLLSLPTVIGNDIDMAASSIVKTMREAGARLVVLDSFQSMDDQFHDHHATRRLLGAIGVLLTYLDITLIVTLTGTTRGTIATNVLTTADIVFSLDYSVHEWRHIRRIEVLKQRGRAQISGLHSYKITSDGITVQPRLESRSLPAAQPRPTGRLPFGLPAFDGLLNGGITAGTTTLLVGAPGVGKTTLGLYWALEAAHSPGTTVFLSFAERPTELHAKAAGFGLAIDAAMKAGTLTLLHVVPVELNPDDVVALLLNAITPATTRVVIDNFSALVRTLGSRMEDFLAAMNNQLYRLGLTCLILVEIKAFSGLQFDVADSALSILADNIVIVQQVTALGAVRRIICVLKMRFNTFDATLRELIIDEHGVRVLTAPESATGVLDAAAEASGLTSPQARDSKP